MKTAAEIYHEDNLYIASYSAIDWSILKGKTILITGATGLICTTLIRGLMQFNSMCPEESILVLALVRDIEKAQMLFKNYIEKGWMHLVIGDVLNPVLIEDEIDYIIHGASETDSTFFVEKPVETILTTITGTNNILDVASQKNVKSLVYLSSMEVYGTPLDDKPLSENEMGYLNPLSVRSSYSESKQMAENLCVSYFSEYGVPTKIIRLTQTFGPGVLHSDQRVFAEFAKCVANGNDIRLKTEGLTQRMYLYTAEAATAILVVLTKGENGQAYNAANSDTYCSIRYMANMVSKEFGQGLCNVVFDIPDIPHVSYNPVQSIYLDTSYIESLGWKAEIGLKEIYARMLICMHD